MARPGALDQRVTLQVTTATADGIGGVSRAWSNLSTTPTVWASVRAKGGGETMVADQQTATQLFLFTIRNRADVTEMNRLVWQSEPYNIRRVERQGPRPMYLTIEAERGVAD